MIRKRETIIRVSFLPATTSARRQGNNVKCQTGEKIVDPDLSVGQKYPARMKAKERHYKMKEN